jgi:RNA polymerase sigma factor (TIGR02999 family)
MATPSPQQVTRLLLLSWNAGDDSGLEKLTEAVYEELRHLTHRYMGAERGDHTLETTALVNEVYLRLIEGKQVGWHNRAHFFPVSARLMRRIRVDWAPSRDSQNRGSPQRVTLEQAIVSRERDEDLRALDEALQGLAEIELEEEPGGRDAFLQGAER